MKRRGALRVVLAVGLLAAVGVTLPVRSTAQAKLQVAVFLPAAGDPYFKLKSCGYFAGGKKFGAGVTLFDAGGYGNLNRQVSQLEDVIQRKVNAIVLVPASSVGTVPAVEKAVDAGIVVINDGIATKSPKVTGFVGENSYLMGQLEAVYMADALGGKGKVVMLSGPSGLDLTNFRVNGFKDYMKYYPDIKIVAEKFSGTASAEALNIMQDYLQSFPDVRGVYTFNGPIAIGAVQALRAAGKKPGQVIVTTLDLEDETKRLIQEGWVQMTAISQPVQMAALAVEMAVRAVKGEKIPAETLTQSTMVTKSTLSTVDLSGQTCPKP